jgi:hypothetical protein
MKMEDDLSKKFKTRMKTYKNGRQPQQKMEDYLKQNGRRPQKKMEYNLKHNKKNPP